MKWSVDLHPMLDEVILRQEPVEELEGGRIVEPISLEEARTLGLALIAAADAGKGRIVSERALCPHTMASSSAGHTHVCGRAAGHTGAHVCDQDDDRGKPGVPCPAQWWSMPG